MVNLKVAVLLIAASFLVAAVAGVAFAQYVSAHANANGNISQTPQGTVSGYYPQQGYPYGMGQYGSACGYGRGMGMGMRGRFW